MYQGEGSRLVSPVVLLFAVAYLQWGLAGLPAIPPITEFIPVSSLQPYGFPAWLHITHYINFLLLILLIRSGLQIIPDF